MSEKCLNCNSLTENNFCSTCGQKNSTRRFSLKYFIFHDFINGAFNLDKGFFFTIKQLFTKPGHNIREYVQGKRVGYLSPFTTIIIIIGIGYFFGGFIKDKELSRIDQEFEGFSKVTRDYAKFVALSWIPFYALTSYLLFKKSRQNYSENLILNMYMIAGILVIEGIFSVAVFPYTRGKVLDNAMGMLTLSKIVYIFWFYFQYFSTNYKRFNLLIRSIAVVFIILLLTKLIAQIVNTIGLTYFQ